MELTVVSIKSPDQTLKLNYPPDYWKQFSQIRTINTPALAVKKTFEKDSVTKLLNELVCELGTLIDAALDGAEYSLVCGGITQDLGLVTKPREELDAVVGHD
ncbi:hypothetical protein BHYA_0047g00340 [Botrytis hyacinthi]|uniref:Uncharacterized protein n=1 Tax=Botrytis hyacinthi TaxID=278943 RepID=A0A4Z1GXI3_9HELO|nr:hypothetical protein BHYA_0047g00340 [Botrytis hyacinthi]